MPPPKNPRLTRQPDAPVRYFPGTVYAAAESNDDEEDEDDKNEEAEEVQRPAPAATNPVLRQSRPTAPAARKAPDVDLSGFVTASESSEEEVGNGSSDEESEEDESEEEDESSSDDESRRPMFAPKFIPKARRQNVGKATPAVDDEELQRKAQADALLQAQIEREAAARAAGKKDWDDDDVEDDVNDEDGVDPEGERAAWKLRELKRVQRDRAAIIEKEKEREELERRRNLTAEEREAEDRAYLEQQAEDEEGKGKMAFMQRYHHKGAFFVGDEQDEDVKEALTRDVAGARFEDETGDKTILPEYMRIRDMTKLGKKGRTKYKDLAAEDTGSWGISDDRRQKRDFVDDRFRHDSGRDGDRERTGANNAPLGERRRRMSDDRSDALPEKRARYD